MQRFQGAKVSFFLVDVRIQEQGFSQEMNRLSPILFRSSQPDLHCNVQLVS